MLSERIKNPSGDKRYYRQNKHNDISENLRRDSWQVHHPLRDFDLDRSLRTLMKLSRWPALACMTDGFSAHDTFLTDTAWRHYIAKDTLFHANLRGMAS
jgi:hypothetical protein